ncbi:MAG: DNA repair protein RadA [Lachnospiraceae bacterium]|nr:DNA repair protein RadA [Lachnospiraceae bacterium]
MRRIVHLATAKKTTKTVFFCNECGYESPKWVGQCPACRAWNTMVEERVSASSNAAAKSVKEALNKGESMVASISQISLEEESKTSTGIKEFDRVLGGGVVQGSLTLVGGDPGIGKSTLLLQMCRLMGNAGEKILYVSGEESLKQIKIRALRIGDFSDNVELMCETNLSVIEEVIRAKKPKIVIIDSIQTMFVEEVTSAPGSVSQVRESTGILMRIAKGMDVSIFIVGHVTKEGTVAGPRVLEHMVDTVLYFEGDRHASYRVLRGVKNRFGSTNEIGVFEMRNEGLVEVANPSEFMLEGRPKDASGCVVSCSMEGTRPILIEIQALVTRTNFGIPRRQAQGADYNRLNLLMAVLEKRVGLALGECDAYLNIAGGIKVTEPAIDLGIVLAVVSSFRNKPLPSDLVAFGEVGLSGEVRSISQIEGRVKEAAKLGFKTCMVPATGKESLKNMEGVKIIYVNSVAEAMDFIRE